MVGSLVANVGSLVAKVLSCQLCAIFPGAAACPFPRRSSAGNLADLYDKWHGGGAVGWVDSELGSFSWGPSIF